MTGAEAVLALPDTIRIGPYDYKVEKWTAGQAASAQRWGEHSSIEQAIRIQIDMPSPIKAVDTFLHEVIHGIFWAYGVEDEDKEERIVGISGTAWTQVYRDNPWLLQWIGKALA